MGRPSKPISEHKRNGTYRADRHGSGVLPTEIPPMPGDLKPTSQAFWNVVTRGLFEAGLISAIDGQALRMGADSWAIYRQCDDEVHSLGIVLQTETKYGTVYKANPAVAARSAAWKEVMKVIREFGMTPSARTGLTLSCGEPENDEEARVMSILKLPGA